jgi:phage terminase small subunit
MIFPEGRWMGRPRSPNRDLALKIYKEHGGNISSAEIAQMLGEKLVNINNWRIQDKWKDQINKIGAPYGNSNAIGNKGGAAPEQNQNHYIHGLYSKYFPKQTVDVMKDTENMAPIDILWLQIHMKFAAIIRAQKIMHVKNQRDMTKELKKTKIQYEEGEEVYREEEFEIQFAWDKQATFLKAQSIAMSQLTNMIKRYDEMLHKDWDMATEEQKLRIENIKQQINNPDLDYKKQINDEKMKLSRERFEHQKKMDELKNF